MRTTVPVLVGVDQGPEFRAVVDAIAELVSPESPRIKVLLDDLPDFAVRLDLVRLAVVVALERFAEHLQVVPVTACYWSRIGTEWLVSRVAPAQGFTFVNGEEQPRERTVALSDNGDGSVRVAVGDAWVDVTVPSEQECSRLLGSGSRGTALRFPVFPSSGPSLIARGDGPDELVLWRYGLPTARFRLPGPVLASIHVSGSSTERLISLIEVDGELLVHVEGDQDTELRKLRVPIDFSVADEAEHDLSPLYLDMDEFWKFGVYFRRAGEWWKLRWYAGEVSLDRSTAVVHEPGNSPSHTTVDGAGKVLFGPRFWHAAPQGPTWKAWGPGGDDEIITVPPGETVLSLTKVGHGHALLTREGDTVRARTAEGVRTVVEFDGPVVLHHGLPWVAVQRSAHLVEVIDVATGAVLHRIDTAP